MARRLVWNKGKKGIRIHLILVAQNNNNQYVKNKSELKGQHFMLQLKHFKNYHAHILGVWKSVQSLNLVTNLYVLVEVSPCMERQWKGLQMKHCLLNKGCPRQFNNLNQFRFCFMVSQVGSYGLRRKNLNYNNYNNKKLAKLVFSGKEIPLT